MANLETLELTINANASSAKQGIGELASSLSSLGSTVGNVATQMSRLILQLKTLQTLTKGMPNLSKLTGALGASGEGAKYKPAKMALSAEEATRMMNSTKLELMEMKRDAMAEEYGNKAMDGQLTAKQIADGALQIRNITDQVENMNDQMGQTTPLLTRVGQGFQTMTGGVGKFFGRIRRIATTMLIRSALRALIKDAKEGVKNFEGWANVVGHDFAQSMQTLRDKGQEVKNSLGAAIAPAIQAAIPVINALANAAITAFNWVSQLIALLTGQSSWAKATEGVTAYTKETNKAGGATKEWIAAFDELNVMNQSGGGGGGGGAVADYGEMFTEVFSFDQQIRELVEFIKTNMESIRDIAIATGVAILAWKVATAFADLLPVLSNIAGLIGVGATIAITLQADWLFTNQFLKTGEDGWLWASMLTTAVGSIVAWRLARQLWQGHAGAWAASITLALAAVTDIVANLGATNVDALSKESILTNIKAALEAGLAAGVLLRGVGQLTGLPLLQATSGVALITFGVATGLKAIVDASRTEWDTRTAIFNALLSAAPVGIGLALFGGIGLGLAGTFATFATVVALQAWAPRSKITWGDIELTDEDAQKFVNGKMFVANVNVPVVVEMIAESVEVTEKQRDIIAEKLSSAMGTFDVIRMGIAQDQDYKSMTGQVDEIINEIGKYIDEVKRQNKLTLQYVPTLAGDDATTQGKWFTESNQGWDVVQTFIQEKGKLVGNWFAEQEAKEIKDSVPDVVAAAMEQINEVSNAIAKAQVNSKAFGDLTLGIGDFNQASAELVLEKYKKFKEDLTTEYDALVKEQLKNQGALVEALKITVGEDDPRYQEALQTYKDMAANMVQAVKDGVESAAEPGKNLIMDWLLNNHKGGVNDTVNKSEWIAYFKQSGFSVETIHNAIRQILYNAGVEKQELEIMDRIEVTGWELLSAQMKKDFLSTVQIDEQTLAMLKQVGVPITDIVKFTDWAGLQKEEKDGFINSIVTAFGADGIKALKSQFPTIKATDIINVGYWDVFTAEEGLNFLEAVKEAFGQDAAVAAAKAGGKQVADAIKEGINSADPDVKKKAEEWAKLLGITPKVSVTPDDESAKDTAKDLNDNVNKNLKQKYKVSVENDPNNPKDTAKEINTGVAGVLKSAYTVKTKPDETSAKETGKKLNNIAQTNLGELDVKLKATWDNLNGVKTKIINAIGQIKLKMDNNIIGKVYATTAATGGLFSSGDIFIANEDGTSEMVGRFGNQTGVANQQQIIAGIQKGVSDANQEQNALLRQQNTLLRGILEKDNSVRIGASAALGRVARQSLNMYSNMIGG